MAESTATLGTGTATRPLTRDEAIIKHKPRTLWSDAWNKFRRHRTAMIGVIILATFIFAVIFGTLIYPVSPTKLNFGASSLPPSLEHPFGTNQLGQDQLARALVGGRISLSVGLMAMLVSIFLGILVGALAGFFGGRLDAWL